MSTRSEVVVAFNVPPLGDEEMEAACRSIKEGAIGGGGKYTRLVEECLLDMTGAPYAYFVTSCTHAVELALMALGVGPGDEVIFPSFASTSTVTCVVRQKAQPVFADIDPVTWNMDPEDVARCLTPRTRVVMPVHYAGHPARFEEGRSMEVPGEVGAKLRAVIGLDSLNRHREAFPHLVDEGDRRLDRVVVVKPQDPTAGRFVNEWAM